MIAGNSIGWIGVDVGTRSVKVAQLLRRGHDFQVIDMAVVPRPKPWSSDVAPLRPISTNDEIATARSVAVQLRGKRAACCTSSTVTQTATLPLDPQTGSPSQEDLANWLPKNVQSVVDFCPAQSHQGQDDAIVCALSEPWSVQLATDVDRAGMSCEAIDSLPLAIARATTLDTNASHDTCVAAIDLGYSASSFVVARDGYPCFVRSLPRCSTRGLLDELSTELRIDADEAERVLLQFGLEENPSRGAGEQNTQGANRGVSGVANFALREFIEEIGRTYHFLQTHQRNRVPTKICLFGGGACIPGIETVIGAHFDIPVAVWQPRVQSGDPNAALPLFGAACGLSLLAWGAAV